jgi:hypothetical protein
MEMGSFQLGRERWKGSETARAGFAAVPITNDGQELRGTAS